MRLHCIELPVPSPDEAGRWLESVLHFLPVDDGRLYVCGNFRLRLVTAEGDAPSRAPDKIVGLEHIALETPDAGALLRALLSKGLELEHDRGVPFFNPKVFGTGTKYFNLIAPFGTKFEFCQRLDKDYPSDSSEILGLEHIGLSAHDFAASFRELSAYGFRPQFAPVENDTPHGRVQCVVFNGPAPIELYCFEGAQTFPEADPTRAPRLVFRANAEASLKERNGACIRCEAAPKYDIVALGEALIDFVPGGQQESGKVSYLGAPGGAPSNVLAAASHLNMQTAFIGKVGNDVFGRLIRSTMERNGICTDGLLRSETEPTTLAFVSLDERGDRSFSFYRQHSADCMLRSAELPLTLLEQAGIFHFGSVSMTAEPVRSATLEAVRHARSKGAAIAFDPNLRLPLWPDTDSAYHAICEGLRYADLVKLSEEELEFLTKAADHTAGMRELLERYDIRMLVVTLGADGCLCLCRNGVFLRQHTIQVTALDTTGSGDAFWGTFLSELLLCDCCDRIPAPQVLQHILGVSCVAGSLTATAFGRHADNLRAPRRYASAARALARSCSAGPNDCTLEGHRIHNKVAMHIVGVQVNGNQHLISVAPHSPCGFLADGERPLRCNLTLTKTLNAVVTDHLATQTKPSLYGDHFGAGVLRRAVDAADKYFAVGLVIVLCVAQGGVQILVEIFQCGGFVGIVGVVQRGFQVFEHRPKACHRHSASSLFRQQKFCCDLFQHHADFFVQLR